MADINKEMRDFFKIVMPSMSKIMSEGIILENRKISKSGETSATMRVPKYLVGQVCRVIIVPQDRAVVGVQQSLHESDKKLRREKAKNQMLQNKLTELVDTGVIEPEVKSEGMDPEEAFAGEEDLNTEEGLENENEY